MTVQHLGWKGLTNGELLRVASREFDDLVTGDRDLSLAVAPVQDRAGSVSRSISALRSMSSSTRAIARSLKIPRTTVRRYSTRAKQAGLSWPLPEGLTESALEAQLFPPVPPVGRHKQTEPDWAYMHRELRWPGVTRQLLWLEYKEEHPNRFQYSRFCELFGKWKGAGSRASPGAPVR